MIPSYAPLSKSGRIGRNCLARSGPAYHDDGSMVGRLPSVSILRRPERPEGSNLTVKLTRFRGARQAFNGGFSDAQDASALFT